MRRWHKFLAPFFALFILLIAVTGLAIQATDLLDSKPASVAGASGAGMGTEAVPVPSRLCAPAKPKRTAVGAWNHWLKTLHSGEAVGPAGTALNLASGAALLFFAASGLWMYLQMWFRHRRARLR
jgi:hypothetical protein